MAKINLRNKLRDKNNNENDNTANVVENTIMSEQNISNKEVENTIINTDIELQNDIDKNTKIEEKFEDNIKEDAKKTPRFIRKTENKEVYPVNEDDIFKKQTNKNIFDSDKNNKKDGKENIFDKLNINKKMFFVAIGMAFAASILVINYLNGFSSEKLYNSEIISVLVARKEIPEKKVITKDDLAKLDIPKKFVLKDSIILKDSEEYKNYIGKIALTTLYPNEQLLSKRLVNEKDSPWVSPHVPTNYRAININSKSLSYIKPSDHVDILISLQNPKDRTKKINTPILQNALVLAVDGRLKISQEDSYTNGNNITVAIPNNLVYLFSLLQDKAEFQLVLRRDDDNTLLESKYSLKDIEKIFNETPVEVKAVNPPPAKKIERIIIQQPTIIKQPIYNAPPPRQAPKPVVKKVAPPKPSTPKKVAPVVQTPQQTTVTVINGTNVKQQNAPKEKDK